METLWAQIQTVLWNVFNRPTIADVLDILIVAFLLYELLMLTKETRASAVLKGLVTLVVASWVSDLLGLTALNWVLLNVVNNGAVVLVILFQPELRKALEQLAGPFTKPPYPPIWRKAAISSTRSPAACSPSAAAAWAR